MPAYSFQKQFVPFVESGKKTHTIRGKRKHRPKPGQPFYGFYAMRTKQCRRIITSTITKVQDVFIGEISGVGFVVIDGEDLSLDECETLAKRDGFKNFARMMEFWNTNHTLPFSGDIIHWKKVKE